MFKIFCFLMLSNLLFVKAQDSINTAGNDITVNNLILFNTPPGISFELDYKGDFFRNISGGINNKSVYLHNIDIISRFDFSEIAGWNGTVLNVHVLGNYGIDPAEYAGAAQGISNIAAYKTWKLYQLWIEHSMLNNKLDLLLGLFDLNSEFDTRETSSLFLNPSHGIGADFALTGANGPSIFPTTSLALRIKYNFSSTYNIKAAVFDGVPGDVNKPYGTHIDLDKDDGILFTAELTHNSASEEFNKDYFKYSAGAWYYTAQFEELTGASALTPANKNGNFGFYLSGEKFLYPEGPESTQGLAAFMRIGYADKDINQVKFYAGTGITYTGIIPGRDEDIAGVAFASINNNPLYISRMVLEGQHVHNYENIIEFTYSFIAADWLKIQPDLQYVINPANCNINNHSLVVGTRVELSL